MGLFSAIVGTAVEIVKLPVAVAKDVVTLGGAFDNNGRPHTLDQLDEIKNTAEELDD